MILQIKNIHVAYDKVRVLNGISLDVKHGEFVTLIGSNGAGKTTMMNTISGLLKVSSGHILFKNKKIENMSAYKIVRSGIAHVPEGRKVFAALNVRDNLLIGAFCLPSKHLHIKVNDKIDEIFSTFPRLKERMYQKAGTLSGGEQQMLAIGRALMSEPDLLILDEPSMGLAPVIVDEVFKLLQKIKEKKMSVLLVEQFAFRALSIADRAYVIEHGKVTMSGFAKDLIHNPEVKKAYLGGH